MRTYNDNKHGLHRCCRSRSLHQLTAVQSTHDAFATRIHCSTGFRPDQLNAQLRAAVASPFVSTLDFHRGQPNTTRDGAVHRHTTQGRVLRTRSTLATTPLTLVLHALPLPGLCALDDGLAEERTHLLDSAARQQRCRQTKTARKSTSLATHARRQGSVHYEYIRQSIAQLA